MTEINGNIDSAQTSAETQPTSGENAEVNNAADNDFVAALFDGEEPETGVGDNAASGEPVATAEEPKDDEGGESEKEPESQVDEQKFTLKVLGQDKEVSLEEMQALAQKGADYDRIREGYDNYKNQVSQYEEQLAAWQSLAEMSGMGPEDFVRAFNEQMVEEAVQARKQEILAKEVIDDGIAERIARAEVRLENQQKTAEAVVTQQPANPPQPTAEQQQEAQMRALAAEIAKLQQDFPELAEPGAKFSDEVVQAVQDGKTTLSDAYRNWVIQKQKEEIKQMEQAARNKAKSVGSLKSDGGDNEIDDFTRELFAED